METTRLLSKGQATRVEDVIGCTGYRGPRKTIEDMDAAIALGVKAHDDRERSVRAAKPM